LGVYYKTIMGHLWVYYRAVIGLFKSTYYRVIIGPYYEVVMSPFGGIL